MELIHIKQIEADVVITFRNEDLSGMTLPLWECDKTHQQLEQLALQEALKFSEDFGSGATTYEIHDFRTEEDWAIINKTKK